MLKGPLARMRQRAFFRPNSSFPSRYSRSGAGLALVNLIQLGKQLGILRDPFIVFFGKPDHALLVDNEYRPLWHTLRPQTIILHANCAVRPKVREHRKPDSTHLFGKGFVRKRRVHAYAQNLSISGFEFFAILFEAAELALSAAGEVERIESQYNILFPLVVLQ